MADASQTTQTTPVTTVTVPTTPVTTTSTTTTPPAEEKKFSQAELDQVVKDRLDREKKKEADRLEQERLKAAGQWEPIIQQKDAEIARLTTQLASLASLEVTTKKLLASQMATLSEPVKEILAKLSIQDQLDWLTKNAAPVQSTTQQQQPPKKPLPTTPDPSAPKPVTVDELVERKRRDQTYSVGM